MKIGKVKIIVVLLLFSTILLANWKRERESLDRVYTISDFRIFYTLRGRNALPEFQRRDLNSNDTPDFVEDIALQLVTADHLYSDLLGFVKPLENERYRGKVKGIDIHLLDLKDKHGSSGDAIVTYHYRFIRVETRPVLSIKIANTIASTSLTPAHELFHCYQNGYTMFKNRWYTEGTARWIEYAFRRGTGPFDTLPQTYDEISGLLKKSYGSKYFWNRLTKLCAKKHRFDLIEPWKSMRLVSSDIKIIEDDTLDGYHFMRDLLNTFEEYDHYISKQRGFSLFDWSEKEQKAKENNRYLLKGIAETVKQYECESNPETSGFLKAIDQYNVQ